jgi:hypothetical protein
VTDQGSLQPGCLVVSPAPIVRLVIVAGADYIADRRPDIEGGQGLQMMGRKDLTVDLGGCRRRSPGHVLGPVGAS